MPRRARIIVPNTPQHVIQRGNNRQACFYADEDYQFYLEQRGAGLAKSYFLMLTKVLSLCHLLTIKYDSLKLPINFCHDKIWSYFFKFRFANTPIQ